MWPRIIELMLGLWLWMSPFIFWHEPEATGLWASDYVCGTLLVVLSLASYWEPTRWSHWLIIPLGLWLVAFGRFSDSPPLASGLQNNISVGLLLILVAIIPNNASQPPEQWLPQKDTRE